MAFHFGIRPWEIDRLSMSEFYGFCDAVDELAKEKT